MHFPYHASVRKASRRLLLAWLACCSLAACVAAPRAQTATDDPRSAGLAQDFVLLADGVRLPLRSWLPAAAPTAVILAVHGFDDYGGGFASTGTFLAARGLAVYAFDQRGFGGAPKRGTWPGGDRMADDVYEVARWLRLRYPGVPLYGLGESMGGAVVLHALRRHVPAADWIDGAALLAPAVWGRNEMPWYARMPLRVLAHTWRGMKLSGRSTGRSPTDDPHALRRLREDPLVIHRARVDVLWGLTEFMDTVASEAQMPAVPVLVLAGGRDEIVPPLATCAWLRRLRADATWRLAFYSAGWHLLTRDSIAPMVHEDLAAWLLDPAAPLPSGADTALPVERLCAQAHGE